MADRGLRSGRSGYSHAEVRALIAPLLGCSAEQLGDYLIVAVVEHGGAEAYGEASSLHTEAERVDLMAHWAASLVGGLEDILGRHGLHPTQHEPGEEP